jgi:hypothetical protein
MKDEAPERYGQRRVPKMYAQVNAHRAAVAAEGTPLVQETWDKIEEHIDFAYQKNAPLTLAEAITVPEVRALVEALEWIKRRKPSDIRPDGGMDMPHREHGEAAYDMWACANAALANLKGDTP